MNQINNTSNVYMNPQELLDAVTLTKDYYFKHVINNKGKFIYSYLPHKNKYEDKYNMLRHAGTVYSMLEIHEIMNDEDLLDLAKKGLKYLNKTVKDIEINGVSSKVVVHNNKYKLGGNALAILAMAKYTKLTNSKKYLPIMNELAVWIKETQNENGWFPVHKKDYLTGETADFISKFYPGECILSLVRLYQIDKNETWLDIAEKAALYLIDVKDKSETVDSILPDHWLLYGLNELYRERPNEKYLQHSLLMAKAIVKIQILENEEHPEYIGGYIVLNPPPKSTQAACYSEGLGAAYKLLRDFGSSYMLTDIKDAIDRGIRFQLQMQIKPDNTTISKEWIGGVQKSPTMRGIRIDYTQHNISSFIQYYDILKNEG